MLPGGGNALGPKSGPDIILALAIVYLRSWIKEPGLGALQKKYDPPFNLPMQEGAYQIVAKYGYEGYPANPNGSDYNTAMICDVTGRHLATMPHFERSMFQWNWANYPEGRKDEVSPWLEAFTNARKWLENK